MRRSWRSSCGAMRMAMSCLAFPEAGRPTLRARRSSASVDSGMSEKSSLLSGIGLAFFAGRLARADDANDFLGMVHLSGRVNEKEEERFLTSAGRPFAGAKGKKKSALLRSK